MKWRWLLFDYIDPAIELSPSNRRKMRRRALRQSRSLQSSIPKTARPSPLLMLVIAMCPAVIMLLAMLPWFLLGLSTFSMIPILILAQMSMTWVVMSFMGRWSLRPTVLQLLRQRGIEVCFGCDYWLRGLDDETERCPECGRVRDEMPVDG